MGFSPEIVSTADYHMIHRTKQPVGAIYELLLLTTTFRSWNSQKRQWALALKYSESQIPS